MTDRRVLRARPSRASSYVLLVAALQVVGSAPVRAGGTAAEETPAATLNVTFSVRGVAKDDALNLRDVPHGDAKTLARIPPDTHGLRGLGCIKVEPTFDRWNEMSVAERANAKLEWCRVEYKGQQGWVAARFLEKERR